MALVFSKVAKAAEELLITPKVLGPIAPKIFHDPLYPMTKKEFSSFISTWKSLAQKFPETARSIERMDIGGPHEELKYFRTPAITGLGPALTNPGVVNALREDPTQLEKLSTSSMHFNLPMMRFQEGSTTTVDPGIGGILTHEFGHAHQFRAFYGAAKEKNLSFKEGRFNLLYRLGFKAGDVAPPSTYGAKNPGEHFAESFTQVVRKNKTDPLINVWNEITPNYRVSAADTGLRRKDHQSGMLKTRRMFGFR